MLRQKTKWIYTKYSVKTKGERKSVKDKKETQIKSNEQEKNDYDRQ